MLLGKEEGKLSTSLAPDIWEARQKSISEPIKIHPVAFPGLCRWLGKVVLVLWELRKKETW